MDVSATLGKSGSNFCDRKSEFGANERQLKSNEHPWPSTHADIFYVVARVIPGSRGNCNFPGRITFWTRPGTLFLFLIRSSAGFNRVTVARFGTPEIAIIDSKSFRFFHRDKSDIIVLFAVNFQLKRQSRASLLELYDISLLLLLFMFNCSSGKYLLLLNFYERNCRWNIFFRRSSSVKFH